MKNTLDENTPIYLQIKEHLEDSIINDTLKVNERVPSTNEFAKYYKINPATAAKGINELVMEEILYKRRGVGMFVLENAKEKLIGKRKRIFYENYITPLKKEAERLGITTVQLIEMMSGEGKTNEN